MLGVRGLTEGPANISQVEKYFVTLEENISLPAEVVIHELGDVARQVGEDDAVG